MRFGFLAAAAMLAACGSARIEGAGQAGGAAVFPAPATVSDAFRVAEAHCRQFDRTAAPTSVVDRLMVFDCR
jgi:hypothetical protein